MPLPLIIGAGGLLINAIAVGGCSAILKKTKTGNKISAEVKEKVKSVNEKTTPKSETSDRITKINARHQKNIEQYETVNKKAIDIVNDILEKENYCRIRLDVFANVWSKIHNRPKIKELESFEVELEVLKIEELPAFNFDINKLIKGLTVARTVKSGLKILSTVNPITAIPGICFGVMMDRLVIMACDKKMSGKVDEAEKQMLEAEKNINKAMEPLNELINYSYKFYSALCNVIEKLDEKLSELSIIAGYVKKDFLKFSHEEQLLAENVALMATLIYNFLKTQIMTVSDENPAIVNIDAIVKIYEVSVTTLESVA